LPHTACYIILVSCHGGTFRSSSSCSFVGRLPMLPAVHGRHRPCCASPATLPRRGTKDNPAFLGVGARKHAFLGVGSREGWTLLGIRARNDGKTLLGVRARKDGSSHQLEGARMRYHVHALHTLQPISSRMHLRCVFGVRARKHTLPGVAAKEGASNPGVRRFDAPWCSGEKGCGFPLA
jgi:hypothetical protein